MATSEIGGQLSPAVPCCAFLTGMSRSTLRLIHAGGLPSAAHLASLPLAGLTCRKSGKLAPATTSFYSPDDRSGYIQSGDGESKLDLLFPRYLRPFASQGYLTQNAEIITP